MFNYHNEFNLKFVYTNINYFFEEKVRRDPERGCVTKKLQPRKIPGHSSKLIYMS